MSNHLSKSLFSIPRLKKSRSRQQNQPENPTSLCLNALTADDTFLRFAAALDKTFSPRATPNGILLFSFAFPVCRVPFRPSQSERNFIFNTAYPPSARHFHPRKAPKRILFLTLHSQSAATFFIPVQSRTEFYFLTLHPSPLRRGPRLPRCITIFSVLSAAFHHAGHRVSLHAEYIQRSCPKCVAPRRNGEIFPPANATAATNRGAGTAIQDEYKKKLYPSARRGIYYTGIIGGGRGGRDILYGDYRQGKE